MAEPDGNIYVFSLPASREATPKASEREAPLHGGGGGGTLGRMESRVTALETHMDYVRRDLDALKLGQDEILSVVRELPTRRDLASWKLQWSALAFAAIAIIIGGIIGGLAWIKPDPAPATPIVVQMPAPSIAPVAPHTPYPRNRTHPEL